MSDATKLHKVYADIVRGFSIEKWDNNLIYIKHLCHFDQVDIDIYYEQYFENALSRGIPNEKDRLKWLEDNGLWIRKNESELSMQKSYIENMEKTRSKLFLQSQIKDMDRQINEGKKKLNELIITKNNLIGLTAERVADQKMQFYYIFLSCFKDKFLQQNAFSVEEINQLDEDEYERIMMLYINIINKFSQNNFRKIAVSNFFTNYFYICGDDIQAFFGKPIAFLSLYQVDLLSYGMYYKRIFINNDIPKDIRENPDKIEEYINRTANFKNATNKSNFNGNRVGLVGATQEDFDILNLKNSSEDMRQVANKEYKNTMEAIGDSSMGGVTYKD